MSGNGSKIVATATRRGDALKLVFDVDHRDVNTFGVPYNDMYSQRCTISVADPDINCWIPGGLGITPGAKVFGTFPRLTFRMQPVATHSNNVIPGDIVLDFRPEPKTATPKIATPEPQPGRAEPEVALVSSSAQDRIPEGNRWTASGESGGSKIVATVTRRSDTLKVEFDVDLRLGASYRYLRYAHSYSQSCTVSVADAVFECWITGRPTHTFGAKVLGAFPRLLFSFRKPDIERSDNVTPPGDIVLDFRPEPRLAWE